MRVVGERRRAVGRDRLRLRAVQRVEGVVIGDVRRVISQRIAHDVIGIRCRGPRRADDVRQHAPELVERRRMRIARSSCRRLDVQRRGIAVGVQRVVRVVAETVRDRGEPVRRVVTRGQVRAVRLRDLGQVARRVERVGGRHRPGPGGDGSGHRPHARVVGQRRGDTVGIDDGKRPAAARMARDVRRMGQRVADLRQRAGRVEGERRRVAVGRLHGGGQEVAPGIGPGAGLAARRVRHGRAGRIRIRARQHVAAGVVSKAGGDARSRNGIGQVHESGVISNRRRACDGTAGGFDNRGRLAVDVIRIDSLVAEPVLHYGYVIERVIAPDDILVGARKRPRDLRDARREAEVQEGIGIGLAKRVGDRARDRRVVVGDAGEVRAAAELAGQRAAVAVIGPACIGRPILVGDAGQRERKGRVRVAVADVRDGACRIGDRGEPVVRAPVHAACVVAVGQRQPVGRRDSGKQATAIGE